MKIIKVVLGIIAVCGFLLIVISAGACDSDMLSFNECVIRSFIGLAAVLVSTGLIAMAEVWV